MRQREAEIVAHLLVRAAETSDTCSLFWIDSDELAILNRDPAFRLCYERENDLMEPDRERREAERDLTEREDLPLTYRLQPGGPE